MTAKARRRALWQANLRSACEAIKDAPEEVKALFLRFNDEIATIGERLQVPPRQMAALLAGMHVGLAFVEVQDNIADDEGIDDFLDYANAANHAALAIARVQRGYTGRRN